MKHVMCTSIYTEKQNLLITVQDDGEGYDVRLKRSGIGISNMIHRIETFNGEMKIISGLGIGCKTYITIPYEKE